MTITKKLTYDDIKHPINLDQRAFVDNKFAHYQWLREEAPVYKGKVTFLSGYFVSRYEDCLLVLKDPRFVRNFSTAGGRRYPIPLPKTLKLLLESMINEDGDKHRRLRTLVHKAFTPRAIRKLEARIESLTHELLDEAEKQEQVDLMQAYSLPIPVTVIGEMLGVQDQDMGSLQKAISALIQGASGWRAIPALVWYFPRLVKLTRRLIAQKRLHPGDDILTGLIQAEEEGDRLTEDELVAMVFLLIIAGYETTVHLITNSVATLLQHPEQLAKLRADPELMPDAVEEILRFSGPVHSTERCYTTEDITLHGVTIPKGELVFPLLGAANRDPALFDNPDTFDITRTPNKHLGFGQGIHYCLGAPLARIETQIALKTLLDRNPNLRLAVNPEELRFARVAGFHSYESLPVVLGD
ncbi:MAG: cytochrome P450 family protein [Ardenticatenaceae bacterium]